MADPHDNDHGGGARALADALERFAEFADGEAAIIEAEEQGAALARLAERCMVTQGGVTGGLILGVSFESGRWVWELEATVLDAERNFAGTRANLTDLLAEALERTQPPPPPLAVLTERIFATPTVSEVADMLEAYNALPSPKAFMPEVDDLMLGAAVTVCIDAADEPGFRMGRIMQSITEAQRGLVLDDVADRVWPLQDPGRWAREYSEYQERRGNPMVEAMPEPEPMEVEWNDNGD